MNISFVGWLKDSQHNHDKVWCVIELNKGQEWPPDNAKPWTYALVWGRRGKALRAVVITSHVELKKPHGNPDYEFWFPAGIGERVNNKIKEGYIQIDNNKLSEIYPEFITDLEKTVIFEKIKL